MNWKIKHILFSILYCSACMAQNNSTALEQLIQDKVFENAHLSVSVKNISEDVQIIDYNASLPLIPASSLKLINNFSALDILGSQATFKTTISHTGRLQEDGTLDGNIVITGGGDPTLGSPDFKGVRKLEELLQYISNAILDFGISCIHGNIIIDDSFFSRQGSMDGWQYNDLGNYYAAGAWSLNIHENMYKLYFDRKNAVGKATSLIKTTPYIEDLTFRNEVTTGEYGTGDNAYIYGGPEVFNAIIRGTIPPGKSIFSIKGSIPNPPLCFAQMLKQKLHDENIDCGAIMQSQNNLDSKTILTIDSPPIERIVYKSNKESNNLYSEALLKLAAKNKSIPNSNSIDAIKNKLSELGLDKDAYMATDGSGLSRSNYITSSLMTDFLDALADRYNIKYLTKLIAQPGQNGTLENVMKNSEHKKNFWIKTGSMSRVQSYSGYFQSQSGDWFSFCIISNAFKTSNYNIRLQYDAFLDKVFEEVE